MAARPAIEEIAMPYTIDAAKTKLFRRPVQSESLPPIRRETRLELATLTLAM
jgi:hypothetical protein